MGFPECYGSLNDSFYITLLRTEVKHECVCPCTERSSPPPSTLVPPLSHVTCFKVLPRHFLKSLKDLFTDWMKNDVYGVGNG